MLRSSFSEELVMVAMIPLSLLSRVEVGLWEVGPGMFPVSRAVDGARPVGLERVPQGLELLWGESGAKGWGRLFPPGLMLRVEQGLSEQGDAVLQVRVELGLPPCIEISHFLSLLSSMGELEPGDASPNKKHSLVISSWVEREEPSWGATWRSLWSTLPRHEALQELSA